ncbi:MAG: 6-phosphogluconate dehydrogenase [Bacteroidia bacterium]|nr:6-phosphogluconate dehydrogenase [Bacteroidia bacterium]
MTLIFGSLAAIVALAGFLLFARFAHYSDGVRSGTVVKFSEKGILFKTWEGQLQFGEASNLWDFSVYPGQDDVQQKILDAVKNGQKVQLKYDESFVSISVWGDTKYFVSEVDIIE